MSAAQLRIAFDDLARIPDTAIVDATRLVEEYAKRTGGQITIHRRKRVRTYPLRAVTKFKERETKVVSATVFGCPTGFWVWKTSGTRSHDIPKRSGVTRYLYWTDLGHPIGFWVRHPGTPGRGRWRKVRQYAETEVPRVFIDAVHDAVAKVA